MADNNSAPRRFLEGAFLLLPGTIILILGFGFLFAVERVLHSGLNFLLGANEVSGSAIGLLWIGVGAHWLWTAVKLFRGDGRPVADFRCFLGGNVLLFLSIFNVSAAIGGFFLDYESARQIYGADLYPSERAFDFSKKALPIAGMVLVVSGVYWFWVAVELLRGNGEQVEDLRRFLAGHTLLFASVFSFVTGYTAFFETDEDILPFAYIAGAILVALGAYWFSIAVKLLRGNREPVASLMRFWGGNALLIVGLVGLLIGSALFIPEDDLSGIEMAGFIVIGMIFAVWGACAIMVAINLLRGKSKLLETVSTKPADPPSNSKREAAKPNKKP